MGGYRRQYVHRLWGEELAPEALAALSRSRGRPPTCLVERRIRRAAGGRDGAAAARSRNRTRRLLFAQVTGCQRTCFVVRAASPP